MATELSRVVCTSPGQLPLPSNIFSNQAVNAETSTLSEINYNTEVGTVGTSSIAKNKLIRFFPLKMGALSSGISNLSDYVYVTGDNQYYTKARVTPIKVRDADNQNLYEEVIARDKVPLMGLTTFNAVPLTNDHMPWYFVQMGFVNNNVSLLMTYGSDVTVRRSSGNLMLFEGRITNPFVITKSTGDEIYGSLVYPEVNIEVHNHDGILNFLVDSPSYAYGGYCQIWRWDPVSKSMIDEFCGIVTEFSFGEGTINFNLAALEREFAEVLIPQNITNSEGSVYASSNNPGSPRGKFYGRNLNVPCPNYSKQDGLSGATPLYQYWAGWGKNKVTAVRRAGEGVPWGSEGVTVYYDSNADATLLQFTERQTDINGSEYPITADIEGCQTPIYNKLSYTENSFSNTSYWTVGIYKTLRTKTISAVVDNAFYNYDGRKTATFFDPYIQGGGGGAQVSIKQETTLANTAAGLLGYWLIKSPSISEVNEIVSGSVGVYNNYRWKTSASSVWTNGASLAYIRPAIRPTNVNTYYEYNYSNMKSDMFALADNWWLCYAMWPNTCNPGTIGLQMTNGLGSSAWPWILGGAQLSSVNTTGVDAQGIPWDLYRIPMETVYEPGYAATRNFGVNLYDLLTNTRYGFGQMSVDKESFENVAVATWNHMLFCDGAINENTKGTDVLNQFLMPLNLRLERKTNFRKLYVSREATWANTMAFGYGDTQGLNNIVSSEQVSVRASTDYPKQLVFRSGILRDESGSPTTYKRYHKIRDLDRENGRILDLSNQFIRYERSADILKEAIWNKLTSRVLNIAFQTTEKGAWNLELGDQVSVYCPSKGINGTTFLITSIAKGFDVVSIEALKKQDIADSSSPISDWYLDNYSGTFPRDRDFDNTYFESSSSGQNTGSTGTASKTIDIPGALPSDPNAGEYKVFGRITSSSGGQEVCVLFQDKTTRVIAKSAKGSPGYIQALPVTETLTFYNISPTGWGEVYDYPYYAAKLSKPAIVSGTLKPEFSVAGSKLNYSIRTGTRPSSYGAHSTEVFNTFEQKLCVPTTSTIITSSLVVQASYYTPADYSAHVFVGWKQDPLNGGFTGKPTKYTIHKDLSITWDGIKDYLRGILVTGSFLSSETDPNTDPYAIVTGVRTRNSKFYLYQPNAQDGTGTPMFKLLEYDRFGYWGTVKCIYQSQSISGWPYIISRTGEYPPAFDYNSLGEWWMALTDVNYKSYLVRFIDIGGTHVAGDVINISRYTNTSGSLSVSAMAIDRTRDEFHVFLNNGEVHVFTSSGAYVPEATLTKPRLTSGYANEAQYSDADDAFYLTLVSGSAKTPLGWQIIGPSMEEISSIKPMENNMVSLNIYKNDSDGYCYITYATTTSGYPTLSLAQIHKDAFIQYGPQSRYNVKTIATSYCYIGDMNTTRAFVVVADASELDYTQII